MASHGTVAVHSMLAWAPVALLVPVMIVLAVVMLALNVPGVGQPGSCLRPMDPLDPTPCPAFANRFGCDFGRVDLFALPQFVQARLGTELDRAFRSCNLGLAAQLLPTPGAFTTSIVPAAKNLTAHWPTSIVAGWPPSVHSA